MSLGKPHWKVGGDSTVILPVLWDGKARNWHCRILNAKGVGLVLSETDFTLGWSSTPRIDIKWLNPGSRWVLISDCIDPIQGVPLRPRKWPDMVKRSAELRAVNSGGFVAFDGNWGGQSAYAVMSRYVRLWNAKKHPTEPDVFSPTVRKPRKRPAVKTPKTALDYILDDEE